MKTKNSFSHTIKFTMTKKNDEFVGWLVDQYGPGGVQADSKWDTNPHLSEIEYGSEVAVHFRNDQDAAVFALRWL
jgi:hypothetical protein